MSASPEPPRPHVTVVSWMFLMIPANSRGEEGPMMSAVTPQAQPHRWLSLGPTLALVSLESRARRSSTVFAITPWTLVTGAATYFPFVTPIVGKWAPFGPSREGCSTATFAKSAVTVVGSGKPKGHIFEPCHGCLVEEVPREAMGAPPSHRRAPPASCTVYAPRREAV